MFNPADLPRSLPLFPLPRALLLPRARLPLNIFRVALLLYGTLVLSRNTW